MYGAGNLAKPVILISPFAPGLKDELTITTTSAQKKPRSYKVMLVSTADKWTQLATFRYPIGE
jgi:type IV secretory pathway VirB9-like protein